MTIPIAQQVDNLPAHKHCEACGASIGLDGRACSEACVGRIQEAVKMRKRSMWVFLAAIAAVLLFTVFGEVIFGRPPASTSGASTVLGATLSAFSV